MSYNLHVLHCACVNVLRGGLVKWSLKKLKKYKQGLNIILECLMEWKMQWNVGGLQEEMTDKNNGYLLKAALGGEE